MDDKSFGMLERDVREIKQDVKALMMFMAVEKAKAKKNTMITSGFISFIVSATILLIGRLL